MNITKRSVIVCVDGDAVVKDAIEAAVAPHRAACAARLPAALADARRRGHAQRLQPHGWRQRRNRAGRASHASTTVCRAALFDPNRLAPTYPDSMITRPFPFNAYYGEDEIREVDGDTWRLEVTGLVADKRNWTLADLRAMPQQEQVTRHICVEGWSAIGKWGGVPFAHFLQARRRRPECEVRGLQVRRRLLHQHRHGHGAAPADEPGADL